MGYITTDIFIETNETFVIRRKRTFIRRRCEDCECEVSMISLEESASLICQNTEFISSMIDKKRIHICNSETETPLICLKSLCSI